MEEKITNNIQLVSIHIPKTAGTTFRTIIQESFGKRKTAKVDIDSAGQINVNNKLFLKQHLNSKIVAIHGHFTYADVHRKFNLDSDVSFVTWLRNPIERVISNYHFLNKIIADRLKELPQEKLMERMGKSLIQFAELEANQNVMSKFLSGANLEQFTFVGIQDHFETELERLHLQLNWKKIDNRKHNVTGKKATKVDEETLAFIKTVNAKDVALYEKAKNQMANAPFYRSVSK